VKNYTTYAITSSKFSGNPSSPEQNSFISARPKSRMFLLKHMIFLIHYRVRIPGGGRVKCKNSARDAFGMYYMSGTIYSFPISVSAGPP
jgi:hypothetical protein